MLSPEEILAGLETIANDWRWLAIVWHGYVALIVVALLFGLRPSLRVFGLLLALPILSVSFLAWSMKILSTAAFWESPLLA